MPAAPLRPPPLRLPPRRRALVAALILAPLVAQGPPAAAAPAPAPLPLGKAGLAEKRTARTVTRGVTHTSIVRGVAAARSSQIATTPYGPWRVDVVTIDPATYRGRLQTTFGGRIAPTEPVSTLGRWAAATVAMNGGFFTYTRSKAYPGDPVGLAVHGGNVVSEPTRSAAEANVAIDATTMRLRTGRFTWRGDVLTRSGRLALDSVNTPPAVPAACAGVADPIACTADGRVVRFLPAFAARTPAGPGAEVVVDRRGCVARASRTRGTTLTASQWSVQATGADAATLLRRAGSGCGLRVDETVRDAAGAPIALTPSTYVLTGRYQLVSGGRIVAPTTPNSISGRNPRSLVGRTKAGKVVLVTVDGRSTASVGTTLTETAALARSLGLVDAVNLDGGGSTTLVVGGKVVNRPSGGRERPVSDALVLIPDQRAGRGSRAGVGAADKIAR